MTTTLDVFISSKMVELKAERDALYALLPTLDYGDIKLRAWVFEEDAPASSDSIRKIYLKAMQNSALYLGLFWNLYGEWTIDEFERATEWGMERHIYVKDVDADQRDPKLTDFLYKHGDVPTGITAKWFKTSDELCAAVKHSIETWIAERLRSRPGGTSAILAQDADDLSERPRKLIGRDDLLHDIAKLLDDGERVLLQGFGGMGKTALAATAAGEWIKAGKGAVLWLKTGSASGDALFEALARPFNAQQAIAGQQGEAKIQAVRQLLRDSGAKLLVLDDCWNGQALFTVLKAVPSDMPVIATARQRFALDNMLDVGELKTDDALTLLLYHAKLPSPPAPLPQGEGEQEWDARALCKTLGNHAFAIEIAGKTLKARKWTAAELLQEIKDAPHDLKTPADFNEVERKSVKDLLDASLNILDEKARSVFLIFGAFFAPRTTPELLKLFKGKYIPIEKALTTLQDHGLLLYISANEQDNSHYRIHELAYSYVKEQVKHSRKKRALDACIAYLQLHNLPTPSNFMALRPEIDNLLNAAYWALKNGYYEEFEFVAKNIYSAGSQLFSYLGLYGKAIDILEKAARITGEQGKMFCHTNYLSELGGAYIKYGWYEKGEETLLYSLSLVGDKHDKTNLRGRILLNLGVALRNQNKYSEAIETYLEVAKISNEINDLETLGNALDNIANTYALTEKYEEAMDYYKQAIDIKGQIGQLRSLAESLLSFGSVYLNQGQFEQSIFIAEQALQISHHVGDVRLIGSSMCNLGSTYARLGKYQQALEYYQKAKTIFAPTDIQEMKNLVDQYINQVLEEMSLETKQEE